MFDDKVSHFGCMMLFLEVLKACRSILQILTWHLLYLHVCQVIALGGLKKTVPTGEKQLPVSSKYFRAPTVSIVRRCSYFCVSWASGAQVINLCRQRMLFVKLRGVRVRKVSWSQVWMLGVTLEVPEWWWVTGRVGFCFHNHRIV